MIERLECCFSIFSIKAWLWSVAQVLLDSLQSTISCLPSLATAKALGLGSVDVPDPGRIGPGPWCQLPNPTFPSQFWRSPTHIRHPLAVPISNGSSLQNDRDFFWYIFSKVWNPCKTSWTVWSPRMLKHLVPKHMRCWDTMCNELN